MATGMERSLHNLESDREKLINRLKAMQTYTQQGISEESRVWLMEQMAKLRTRIALVESAQGAFNTLYDEGGPDVEFGPMPADVRKDLEAVRRDLAKAAESLADEMDTMLEDIKKPPEMTTVPPPRSTTKADESDPKDKGKA
jgi:hypothetical protein